MKLSHRYFLFNLIIFLTIISQLAITGVFVYWTWTYFGNNWNLLSEQISGLISSKDYDFTTLSLIGAPVLKQFIIFVVALFLLGFTRKFTKALPMSHQNILGWTESKEIHPLLAQRLAYHFTWNKNISHEDFFTFWNDFKVQNRILEQHQQNKSFYDFLTTYNPQLAQHKPYPTVEKTIIRREEMLKNRVEPSSDEEFHESEKDKDML